MLVKLAISSVAGAFQAAGYSMLATRRLMCAAGYTLTALPVLFVPALAASSPWATTACFCVALAGTGFHAEGFRANYLDVTRTHVGLVSGVGNCLSSVAAMAAPFIVGALVSRAGSWDPVWYCVSGGCVASTVVFCSLSSTTPVEQLLKPGEAADAQQKKAQ